MTRLPSVHPAPLSTKSLDRRSLVRAAAWSVPAVAAVAAAPAFAASGPAEGCTDTAVLRSATWSVVAGSLLNPARPNTGWSTSTSSLPTFSGATVVAGSFALVPAGAFISFADNANPNARAVINVKYEFAVTGTVTLQWPAM